MLNGRSEQRRRNLSGIHPPACTCVDCDRMRRGLPPLSSLPTQPTEEDWDSFNDSTDPTLTPSDASAEPVPERVDVDPTAPPESGVYQRPQLTGFWGLPWGWMSLGFWIAMVIKNAVLGQMDPSLTELILLGSLDVAAVVCLILKVGKVVKLRNLNAGRSEARSPASPPTPLVGTYPEPETDNTDYHAAIHPSIETEGDREPVSGESRVQGDERPGNGGIHAPPEWPASPLVTSTPTTAGLSYSPRRLLAPMLITLIPLAAIAGGGGLAYLLLGGPTVASSREIAEPTPDLQATIEAAVALALAKTDAAAATSSGNPGPADSSAPTQAAMPAVPPMDVATHQERLRSFNCSYCDATDAVLGHHVHWEWEPVVSDTGRLAIRALIDEQANFSGEGIASCTANVSLSDDSGAFYGWVISRNKALQCGKRPADWVSNLYHYENNILSLEAQLDTAAATHPGLAVCLWTGGFTKNESRVLDCKQVRQP